LIAGFPKLAWSLGTYRFFRVLRLFLALESRRHKHAPTAHHLQTLGTDASFQGKGIGSKLIQRGIDRAEALNLPCYLESSNPRNVPFYERHGFKTVELFYPFADASTGTHKDGDGNKLEGNGPLMTLMLRPTATGDAKVKS